MPDHEGDDTVMLAAEVFESWAVTVGSLVAAAGILTGLTKVPGFRWLFRALVQEPVLRAFDQRIMHGIGLQREVVQMEVQQQLQPVVAAIADINQAVNNVPPGTDPIKDKVAQLQTHTQVIDEKLDTLTTMVQGLAARP